MISLQSMSVGDCSPTERSHVLALLLEGLEKARDSVASRLSEGSKEGGGEGRRGREREAVWQATVTLSALWHSMQGRCMPLHPPTAAEPAPSRRAASESIAAFLQASARALPFL